VAWGTEDFIAERVVEGEISQSLSIILGDLEPDRGKEEVLSSRC